MAFHSEKSGKRVLVTGLGGFTGRYLAKELQEAGYAVHGLVSPGGNDHVDLLDEAAVKTAVARIQPNAVIHLAGVAFAAHSDVDKVYRTNIVGSRHLLAALAELQQKPETVLFASSALVYGNSSDSESSLDENSPLRPANDYAVSKLAMEYMARTWSSHFRLVFCRPFNYTGVGQDPRFLVPKIVSHFSRGDRHIELGNLDVWREFMDVRTVVWAYRRLLETDNGDDTFNICTGVPHSLREVLAAMADIAGYDIEVRVNPAFVRENEIRRLAGDPSRLQSRIGAMPSFSLSDTLRWMYHAPN
ncbi:GDP-mannose 4,6-dehydratase [Dyella flava]|uniref:GDP-mannose 4,6-dehydratase n=1 Tax=Dyella flava TaxID=1920170 RepID=A0ABS2K1U5_9GAMM|nr:GDP-mannose 4,6-dehydratase [Dyella flava]MBM7124600.1 GDP-mannose 4,6-dehydratase [Dyella flava]GLQ49253.1 UDP-glucose 4-epimerase [Dyella flava]